MNINPQSSASRGQRYLQRGLWAGVTIAVLLVFAGRFLVPTTSWLSTLAALTILLGYGGLATFYPSRLHRRHPDILSCAIFFGLLAAGVFTAEIILEYVLLPKDNSRYGLLEFGAVFALYTAAAFVVAFRSRRIRNGVLTSMASAFIASLVWAIAVLSVFYAFRGSQRQVLVLRAEGNYQDFARSGLSDFDTFIMQDFMGAIFFHLSLGLLVAAILGSVGGVLGIAIARLRK